ncbi:MAG TPA: endopeptidase La [Myxococcales bacterium]|nr:endopeptidase La [Myxococcales bacterium]
MTTHSSIPVFVLDDAVLLPGGVARLEVSGEVSLAEGSKVLVAFSSDKTDLGVHETAALGTIRGTVEGGVIVAVSGRARITEMDESEPLPLATAEEIPFQAAASGTEIEALMHETRRLAGEIFELLPGLPREALTRLTGVREPGAFADLLAHAVPAEPAEKQKVLETLDPSERLKLVITMLARRRETLKVAHDIEDQVQQSVGKAEREHILRKKMQAIQKELGEGDEAEKDNLAETLKALTLPDDVRQTVDKELARLGKLPESSPERSVSRNWLQAISELPWGKLSVDDLDVENARKVLDDDHRGLAKVKKRVLQFLAVRKLRGDLKGPILVLAGPPGVGKTSLGQSVARAMGRKFVRVSLGGVRDEAEIRGHRRTYVGAMPGRIAQALKRAGTSNPVVMLDEIDKVGQSAMGDPSAALLEVLDPEQNHAFVDHYLEVPLDLSRVLFIATANDLSTVPAALRDRMEILDIPSYTLAEKADIAQTHLWQKQLLAHGLAKDAAVLSPEAMARVVSGHTREAGVRGLEKRLAEICRALAVEQARDGATQRTISSAEIETLLGPDRFESEMRETDNAPGIAAGLAWTPVGGDVLYIETLRMPGTGKVILSGQLGSVMQESARAALSYVQSNAAALGVPAKPLEGIDVHVHVPAGGTPKDGPSAGVTLFTALVSLLSNVPVRSDTAMTGEATLRGRVLPVGGIKEKVLAAHRLGMKRIIIPRACGKDLRDVPEETRNELDIVLVDRMEEVLAAALVQPAAAQLRVAA